MNCNLAINILYHFRKGLNPKDDLGMAIFRHAFDCILEDPRLKEDKDYLTVNAHILFCRRSGRNREDTLAFIKTYMKY